VDAFQATDKQRQTTDGPHHCIKLAAWWTNNQQAN